MRFNDIDELKKAGFEGFKTIKDLFLDSSILPNVKGVYLVLTNDIKVPTFLPIGSGGHFKGKNPNISLHKLSSNWIDKTRVVYIGKAGSESGNSTLRKRLRQYLGFGQGKAIGHWGGRHIWQLAASDELIVCWKPLTVEDPKVVESALIREFIDQCGKRPFANLQD